MNREDFPLLKTEVNGKQLSYLDNAATSQKPQQVIDAVSKFYTESNANIHRSIYKLGEDATKLYEDAHTRIAGFINARPDEIAMTSGTTQSLNALAYSLTQKEDILVTPMEHHSNFVPWQQIAKQRKLNFKVMDMTKQGELSEEIISADIKNTGIVAVTHVSNVLGTINDIKKIVKIAHENNALVVVDAAQSVPHMSVDVKKLDCDFLAFSGHKMLGPTGTGVLYGKKEHLENLPPFMFGGEMIKTVSFDKTEFNDLPWKFEAGTQNIAGVIGLASAVDYLENIGMSKIEKHEDTLTKYAMEKLSPLVEIYGPENRAGIISFNVKGVHAHDTAQVLDGEGIAVRAGHHCAMPLAEKLGITASARASFYLYNTKEEIDRLVAGVEKVIKVFS